MSYLHRDEYKKVSEPTEVDFARGLADSFSDRKGIKSFWVGLAIGAFASKLVRRK